MHLICSQPTFTAVGLIIDRKYLVSDTVSIQFHFLTR